MTQGAQRTLVISPNWIGDAVMAQPLLQLLKRHEPTAPIDVLAPAWVAPIWRAMRLGSRSAPARLCSSLRIA
jgi:heptosyltransferase-2